MVRPAPVELGAEGRVHRQRPISGRVTFYGITRYYQGAYGLVDDE